MKQKIKVQTEVEVEIDYENEITSSLHSRITKLNDVKLLSTVDDIEATVKEKLKEKVQALNTLTKRGRLK